MGTIEGNSDANGSLDKAEPYMKEAYSQRRARLEREIAERAALEAAPEPRLSPVLPPISRMPGNGSFA